MYTWILKSGMEIRFKKCVQVVNVDLCEIKTNNVAIVRIFFSLYRAKTKV